ncbi:Spc19-domain-containing protein [Linnemannia elongata]|nr:Spc19-domain-containing protein [Linnemannia elongata]
MDTHGNGFGYGGSYSTNNNNTLSGHAGHGLGDYGGSSTGPRRTYTPTTSTSSIFMPSLKRCVNTLDLSTQLLKSSVSMLDEATSGYPRLKTIASHNKKYELVSEEDIALAREEVTKEISPQLTFLSEKVANIIFALEAKEYELMDLVNVEKEKEQRRLQLQKAASSGLSNIKKLKSLTKRKEELSRSASELDDVLDQKRQQFSQLLKRVSGGGSTAVPAKKQRRSPTHESRELTKIEEERKKEIARRNRELQAIQQKIEDKQKAVRELQAKSENRDGDNSAGQDAFTPSKYSALYQ